MKIHTLAYMYQGSKFNFLKSRLLATFNSKMVAIKKVLAPLSLIIWPRITMFYTLFFFFFQICWWPTSNLSWNFGYQISFLTPCGDQNGCNLEHCVCSISTGFYDVAHQRKKNSKVNKTSQLPKWFSSIKTNFMEGE